MAILNGLLKKLWNVNFVSLRYFNAAGCDFDCEVGELHDPETHLIPLVLDAAIGKGTAYQFSVLTTILLTVPVFAIIFM